MLVIVNDASYLNFRKLVRHFELTDNREFQNNKPTI